MIVLEGKSVAEKIKSTFAEKIENLEKKPCLAVLGIRGDDASDVYIRRIQKNCEKYGIEFILKMANTEEEFKQNFEEIKNDDKVTGIMFQQPLPNTVSELINEVPAEKDIEGIGAENMGRLMLGRKDVKIPCTSKAVIETLDYYNIDLTGKKVVIVGRSNIVGKPLIPQILEKNATVTICHSRTKNIEEELKVADVIIMAIGKAKFLKKEYIKEGAILIDVGINFEDGKIVGDIDFEDIKDKASMCTPVPGGIGTVTNALLIDNIIK
ncbi:MAG: bifunctional 5,10-methylenetetrahydrofolate dehydrogenase/5,10-methenyltetrahydrofolate cyclohydrolase [Clostridia bacterium]|nr:bifunctional 5,10-methylenetetrahydrofolate dehydrogenase/5,10-methenyltetrahydrofolate cyclohydrolase [Clostridia bacterium]